MKLSVKSDYATRAVLGLARRYLMGRPCRVEDLAVEQGIPAKYLVQILIELKAKQVVRSQRGKEGGYLLARAPGEITFGEVLRAVEGEPFDAPGLSDPHCPPELRSVWERVRQSLTQTADSTNFQTLLEDGEDKEKMYYI